MKKVTKQRGAAKKASQVKSGTPAKKKSHKAKAPMHVKTRPKPIEDISWDFVERLQRELEELLKQPRREERLLKMATNLCRGLSRYRSSPEAAQTESVPAASSEQERS